jgi:hypothetical protein
MRRTWPWLVAAAVAAIGISGCGDPRGTASVRSSQGTHVLRLPPDSATKVAEAYG